MNKIVAGAIVGVVALAALAGIYAANKPDASKSSQQSSSGSPEPPSDEVLSGTVEMDIKDFDFARPNITIKKGTTVKWTNQDTAKHDVTPDDPSAGFEQSELLGQGGSYSVTFNTPGTFSYFCSPHPFMKGAIEVVE